MNSGMVRKVDELGRVVIPKEMRRILKIQTGSSIEMTINENGNVELKKFSELKNAGSIAQILCDYVYEKIKLPCVATDDEEVLAVCGTSKKEFLHKKIVENYSGKNIVEGQETLLYSKAFSITIDGFSCGNLYILSDDGVFSGDDVQKVEVITGFASVIMQN